MKLKDSFVLRQIADMWVVLPLAEQTVDFSGMLTLNDSGAMLWKVLESGGNRDALVETLTTEYDVAREDAANDVDAFMNKLIQAGCLEQ